MDDIVKAALAKWPNVPHCFGWLALDARGHWYLRDEAAQRAGAFPQVPGSRIEQPRLLAFIGRNYAADAAGRWYFQNGPQRVYVDLAATPWVWRLRLADGEPLLQAHTGAPAGAVSGCWLDEADRLYLATDLGFGLLHSADMYDAAQAVEDGRWQPRRLHSADAPARFGFVRCPAPA